MGAAKRRFKGVCRLAALLAMAVTSLSVLVGDVRASDGPVQWSSAIVRRDAGWYASAQARAVADSVLQYQSPQGGWPKSTNLATPPRTPDDVPAPGGGRANTLDNDATTLPMEFLARMVTATGEPRYRQAFDRGLAYLLEAQYPSGGWPQFYPLRDGYYSHITFNDDAMVRVMVLLRDVAAGEGIYGFVDATNRARAAAAVDRGVDLILRTQVQQNGQLAGWCAQYDAATLRPAWARAYEPPSLSGNETVGILGFLMSIEQPDARVVAAVEGGVAWLRSVAVHGVRLETVTDASGQTDRVLVADASAPPLWARFYEFVTDRPLFLGRDSVFRYNLAEIESERRGGYHYYGTWPSRLLSETYPNWRSRRSDATSAAGSARS